MLVEATVNLGNSDSGQTTGLYQAMLDAGLSLAADCGGSGRCGRCQVLIEQGDLEPPDQQELERLAKADAPAATRLACRTIGRGPVKIKYRPAMTSAVAKTAVEKTIPIKPVVTFSDFQAPSSRQETADRLWSERLLEAVRAASSKPAVPGIDLEVLSNFSLRKGCFTGGGFKAAIDDQGRIRSLADQSETALGLAIDVGTTTMALYLSDLETGRTLARRHLANPQACFGADVVSRMEAVQSSANNLALMRRTLAEALNQAVRDALAETGRQSHQILDAVMVGNPTMQHIFMGLNPTPLSRFPYLPIHPGRCSLSARELGLNMAPGGRVETMPMVSGYIGADALSALLAIGEEFFDGANLLMDVGTNGELVFSHSGRLIATSCATGPVFEGAHIKSGVRAAPGAVEFFRPAEEGSSLTWTTIAGQPPLGLCGTGVISAVWSLVRTGRLDRDGFITKADGEAPQGEYLKLIDRSDTSPGRDLVLYQSDVRQVQVGKSALRSGLEALLRAAGKPRLDRVYLAGAFGGRLPQESLTDLGFLPPSMSGEIRAIGNAAGEGARMMLLNADCRRQVDELAGRVEVIELMLDAGFEDDFIKHTCLGEPEVSGGA